MKISQKTRSGFSMVEMLMVLAIMGIIVTLTISSLMAARPHAQLERGELVVAQTLNQARNLAISDELAVRVSLDPDANTMTIAQADPGTTDYVDIFGPYDLPDGIEFEADGITFDGNNVQFTPRGSLLSGGEIEISNSAGETTIFTGNLATGKFPLTGGNLR